VKGFLLKYQNPTLIEIAMDKYIKKCGISPKGQLLWKFPRQNKSMSNNFP
jgi:hypothetical protein